MNRVALVNVREGVGESGGGKRSANETFRTRAERTGCFVSLPLKIRKGSPLSPFLTESRS